MKTIDIIKQFAKNDDACTEYLCHLRWDKQPECPYCNDTKTGIRKKEKGRRMRLQCHSCNKSFSPTVNTIMHNTHIPLWKWFLAISLLAETKKSVSSRQLGRHLDLPVKTAYSLSQRIRKGLLGMRSPILSGIIEIDETYIGGKPRYKKPENIRKRGRGTDKAVLVGMMERKGKVISKPVESYKNADIRNMVLDNIIINKSEIHTKDYKSVVCPADHIGYNRIA